MLQVRPVEIQLCSSLNLATQNLNVLFSGYSNLFAKEGDKELKRPAGEVKLRGEPEEQEALSTVSGTISIWRPAGELHWSIQKCT